MINEGYGSPFVLIFNFEDKEITPHKITRFRYVHSEKADDASNIVIESLDPNLLDNPDFQENKQLKIQWGYIGGKVSKKRTVYIFDSKGALDESGVRLELDCYDKLAYLKLTSNKTVHKDTNLRDLAKKIAEKNGMVYNEVKNEFAYNTDRNSASISILQENNLFTTATESTATQFKQYVSIPQANKSDAKLLQDIANKEAGGPYIVEGRDDELIIRKRNFNKEPIRIYKYKDEPGYLLKFTPETKNKSHRAGAANVQASGWNPEMKSFILGDIGQVHDNDGEESEVGEDTQRTIEDRNNRGENFRDNETNNEDYLNESYKPLPNNGAMKEPEGKEGLAASGKKWSRYEISTESLSIQKSDGNYTTATESTAVLLNRGGIIPDLNESHDTTGQTEAEISAEAINRRRNAELEKNPANATMVGDTDLESGQIITILNVSNKNSGNYYITQVSHNIDPSGGYISDCQLVKAPYNLNNPLLKKYKKDNNLPGDNNDIPQFPTILAIEE